MLCKCKEFQFHTECKYKVKLSVGCVSKFSIQEAEAAKAVQLRPCLKITKIKEILLSTIFIY